MRDDMTDEERGFRDKLEFFYNEKMDVHLTLKRLMSNGNRVWLNGELAPTSSDKVWNIDDRKLGTVRVALAEIAKAEEVR